MSKANEWDLLKRQFDALMDDESVGAESIDEIFDIQFRQATVGTTAAPSVLSPAFGGKGGWVPPAYKGLR